MRFGLKISGWHHARVEYVIIPGTRTLGATPPSLGKRLTIGS